MKKGKNKENPKTIKITKKMSLPASIRLLAVFIWIQSALSITRNTNRIPASKMFSLLSKSAELKINTINSMPIESFGSEWFIEYNISPETGQEAPLIRIVAVLSQGVFMKKFTETWMHLDPILPENREMDLILPASRENLITAHHMNRNNKNPILTLAFSDLTLTVLNLKESKKLKAVLVSQKTRIIHLAHEVIEEEHRIRSIGNIPYTDFLVVAPHRFGLYKIDRMTGEILRQVRPSLDQVRFIVLPVRSSNEERDPYNPRYRNRTDLSKRMQKLVVECSTFLMTSHNSEFFTFVDWATLKPYNTFTWRKFFSRAYKEESYIIGSAAYFGGVPEAHLYILAPSYSEKYLLVFSGIYRSYAGYKSLGISPKKMKVTWMYGTKFIFCLAIGVDGESEDVYQMYLIDMGPFQFDREGFKDSNQLQGFKGFQHINMIVFNLMAEEDKEIHLDTYTQLDYIYLMSFIDGNTVRIRPPFFNWDTCEQTIDSWVDENKMLYGRWRKCKKCARGLFQISDAKILDYREENVTFINCIVDRTPCDKPTKVKPAITYEIKKGEKEGDKDVYSVKADCFPQYELQKDDDKNTKNDNKCQPGYNLDVYGICRKCKPFKFDVSEPGDPEAEVQISDCLTFSWDNVQDSLMLTYHRYNKTKYSQAFFYKGSSDNGIFFFEKLFKIRHASGVGLNQTDYYRNNFSFVIKDAKTYDYKQCYDIFTDPANIATYRVETIQGYYLDKIDNDVTKQAETQVKLYSDTGKFNEFFCKKIAISGSTTSTTASPAGGAWSTARSAPLMKSARSARRATTRSRCPSTISTLRTSPPSRRAPA